MVEPRIKLRNDVLIVAVGAWVLTVVAFVILGRMYFIEKHIGQFSGDPMAQELAAELAWDSVKATMFWSFAVFVTAGTVVNAAAVYWPRIVGFGVAAAYGLAFVFAGSKIMMFSPMPVLVGIFVAALGGLLLALSWVAWSRPDRAAWSFLLALSGVLAVAMFFGAPKIKRVLEVDGLWWIMIMPAAMAAVAVACHRLRRDYA